MTRVEAKLRQTTLLRVKIEWLMYTCHTYKFQDKLLWLSVSNLTAYRSNIGAARVKNAHKQQLRCHYFQRFITQWCIWVALQDIKLCQL